MKNAKTNEEKKEHIIYNISHSTKVKSYLTKWNTRTVAELSCTTEYFYFFSRQIYETDKIMWPKYKTKETLWGESEKTNKQKNMGICASTWLNSGLRRLLLNPTIIKILPSDVVMHRRSSVHPRRVAGRIFQIYFLPSSPFCSISDLRPHRSPTHGWEGSK